MSNTWRPDTPENPTPVSHALLAVGKNCPLVDRAFDILAAAGWTHRPGQVTMSQVIRRAWKQRLHAITEAGTGTGKTAAYLVPAILHALETNKPVVVSTKTTTLQRQLQTKDLPALREHLTPWLTEKFGRTFTFAVRFGISRYLCQAKDLSSYPDIEAWETEDGDLGRFPYALPPGTHRAITADHNSCPGSRCRMADTCFYLEAKRASRSADIVVVSHALLMASLLAQPGTVLPLADAYVIDEAHELEREARECRGVTLTPRRVSTLVARVLEFCGEHQQGALWPAETTLAALPDVEPEVSAGRMGEAATGGQKCVSLGADLDACAWCDQGCQEGCLCGCHCTAARHLSTQAAVDSELAALFQTLADQLRAQATDGAVLLPDLQHTAAAVYLEELQGQLRRLRQEVLVTQEQFSEEDEGHALAASLAGSLVDLSAELRDLTSPREGRVAWLQMQPPSLHAQPLDVSQFLKDSGLLNVPVTLSSATLDAGDQFAYVQESLGIRTPHQCQAPSPFRWEEQAWLYLPEEGLHEGLFGRTNREANQREFFRVSALHIREVLRWTKGRSFCLFTSLKALEATKEFLGELPWPHITQGEMGQAETLEWFRSTPNSVLFGLESYWTGVDLAGDSLSCVILNQIPFAPPSDLLHAARVAAVGRQGFQEISVPLAVTKLRQGCGRLIRTVWDRGLLVLLDPRLRGKHSYILDALPAAKRISRSELKHVPIFLAASGEPVEGPDEVLHGLMFLDLENIPQPHRSYAIRMRELLPLLTPGLWKAASWLVNRYSGDCSDV